MLSGFKKFLLWGNVVDMAVGVVVGAAFGTLVSSLVKDLLTPLIADFSKLSVTLNNSRFLYGDFSYTVCDYCSGRLFLRGVAYQCSNGEGLPSARRPTRDAVMS